MKRIALFILLFTGLTSLIKAENEWQLYSEKNGVKIYYKYSECINKQEGTEKEYVLFKLINTTDVNMIVEWERRFWYDGKCKNCDSQSPEYHSKLELKAGETLEGCCDLQSKRDLKICSRVLNFKDVPILTKFELENLSVNPK